jgi:hypothetical protein
VNKKIIVVLILIPVFILSVLHYKNYQKKIISEVEQPSENTFTISSSAQSSEMQSAAQKLQATASTELPAKTNVVSGKIKKPEFPFAKVAANSKKDNELWPIRKNPDYWLIKSFVNNKKIDQAAKICDEALIKPLPAHFRVFFSWLLIRLKFTAWLGQNDNEIETQVRERLKAVLEGSPSRFNQLEFRLGTGFVASAGQFLDFPDRKTLLSSATLALHELVDKPDKFAIFLVRDLEKMNDYYQKLRIFADKGLPEEEFFGRYAEVDYLFQERRLIPGNSPFASAQIKKNIGFIENNWRCRQIPLAFGKPFIFDRNHWTCPFYFGNYGITASETNEPGSSDAMQETWSAYFLQQPEDFEKLLQQMNLMELESGN